MKRLVALATQLVAVVLLIANAGARELPAARPEAQGLSSERLERVSTVLRAQIEAGKIPGVVALIARRGHVVYFESFGARDKAAGAPLTRDAIFRLYSMTKPFTAVAAMMLMEEGRLAINDPVSKFIPQLGHREVSVPQFDPATGKVGYVTVPAEREITIQDLMRHTSGIVYGRNTPNPRVAELYAANKVGWADQTPEEQIERLAKVPLASQPGTTWEYSLSTDVLGRVVEKVAGMRLGQFLAERLFAPLKMADTGFVVAGSAGTAMDYARFAQMMLNGGQLDGVRLLSPTTVAFMTSDHLGPATKIVSRGGVGVGYGFGLGFAVRTSNGIATVSGSAGEYRWAGAAGTAFWTDPQEQMVTVLMTQGAPGPARGVISAMFRQMVRQAIVE